MTRSVASISYITECSVQSTIMTNNGRLENKVWSLKELQTGLVNPSIQTR